MTVFGQAEGTQKCSSEKNGGGVGKEFCVAKHVHLRNCQHVLTYTLQIE